MAGAGIAGAALGTIGSIVGVFGEEQARHDYPTYQPVDLQSEINKAAQINLGQLPTQEQIAARVNQFTQAELDKRNKASGITDILDQSKGVVSAMMRGELSPDIVRQLRNDAAAYGIGSGTIGSEFANAAGVLGTVRARLAYQAQGLSSADQWSRTSASLTRAPLYDITSSFVNPMQVAGFDAQQQALAYQSRLGKWSLGNFMLSASKSLEETGGMWSGVNFGGGNKGGTPPPQTSGLGPGFGGFG